jgi:RNase P subunit RPR2
LDREAQFVRSWRASHPRSRATRYYTQLPGASWRRYVCVACRRLLAREEASALMSAETADVIKLHALTCKEIARYADGFKIA